MGLLVFNNLSLIEDDSLNRIFSMRGIPPIFSTRESRELFSHSLTKIVFSIHISSLAMEPIDREPTVSHNLVEVGGAYSPAV